MGEPLLQIKNLTAAYGKSEVLFGLDLEVRQGELVALIGSNGAGKSTLLKCIFGWLKPSGGSIAVEGQAITGWPAERVVSAGIAHCPEGRRVFPFLTVLENLKMGAYSRKGVEWKADLERVFRRFPRLNERQRQLAGSLSGGEQQMLAIGRALMAAPRLILFDEPSLGLAPVIVEQMFEIIDQVRQEGTTVLLVEQNASLALQMADRGYVMESGLVVRTGLGKDLLHDTEIQKSYLGIA
jgi:branched-chain amino acid transport system ATP-binding protein